MSDNVDSMPNEKDKKQSNFQKDWSVGLRIIFWFCLFCLPIGIVQNYYFIFVRHELQEGMSFQGFYGLSLTLLSFIAIYYGIRSNRRRFIFTCLIAGITNAYCTLYFFITTSIELFNRLIMENYNFGYWIEHYSMYIGWNFILVCLNIVVIFYLWLYECKFTDEALINA
ncbi:MAG: hypothetical protein GY795_06545 [Desulfobacterales bacterium]|nr:hypothetical protein [Desulfobacterales bacterium]